MKNRAISIAVCSVVPHLGTTTTAFQIIGYLSLKGADTAYVDMTKSEYIDNLQRLYAGVEKNNKVIKYADINIYKDFSDIDNDYDYIVKDYGCIKNNEFNKTSYLEQDIQVVCCGVKPDEMFELTSILKDSVFNKVKFAFNFVPYDQRDSIINSMGERKDQCIFLGYTPDPFTYDGSNNKSFHKIIENIPVKQTKNTFYKSFKRGLNKVFYLRKQIIFYAIVLFIYTILILFISSMR